MRPNWFTRTTSTFVAVAHLLISVIVFMPSVSHAQSTDVNPPTIELEIVEEGIQGDTQVFSATVSEDNAIASMLLHYRFGDSAGYRAVPMSPIAGTSIYTASVETSEATVNFIQYYMEARDTGGNRTVQGFAFDPFERTLVSDPAAIAAIDGSQSAAGVIPTLPTPESSSGNRNFVFGVIAAAIVGGLLVVSGAASGGGSGGTASAEETELTIIVDNF